MAYLTLMERLKIPTYDNPKYARSGRVTIDREKCNGCGNCALICPGGCLYVAGIGKDKRAHLMEEEFPNCMSCNDCAAMCARDAIAVSQTYDFGFFYKTLHRGGLCAPRKF
jgi:formate hydrogenlyase subunit 6/NADH:ubiquinone oxidoreductase subunit I